MSVMAEEGRRLALESDGPLYDQAVAFVSGRKAIDDAQLHALLQHAQRWADLRSFVARQAGRKWEDSRAKAHYRAYYADLKAALDRLEQQAQATLPDGLTQAQRRERTASYAEQLGREFIQHLWAEALCRL